jgi:hypothetical protein
MPAIPASPVDAADPGNADAGAQGDFWRRAFDDLTYDLMTRNQGLVKLRKFAFDDMQIGSADAAGPHPQKHLPG